MSVDDCLKLVIYRFNANQRHAPDHIRPIAVLLSFQLLVFHHLYTFFSTTFPFNVIPDENKISIFP